MYCIYIHIYICKIITMSSRVLNTHTSGACYNNNNNDVKDGDFFCYFEFHTFTRLSDRYNMLVTTTLINKVLG